MAQKTVYIDINCDVGEGIENEKELFPLISSCNIACGGHTGNIWSMLQVARLAKQYNVKVGAHPSYPDTKDFGRVSMHIAPEKLIATIREQVSNLIEILDTEDMKLHHIKPHGALYNDLAKDEVLARTFLEAIEKYKHSSYLYVPYASAIEKEALKQGFKIKHEAFGDRNYNRDLTLVSRKKPNALIENPDTVLKHILLMHQEQKVRTIEGGSIKILADTYCIHGDTPSALQILMYLSKELPTHNIQIKK